MRKILTSFSLVAASLAFAQVGINADENDIANDAVFHVENKSGEAKGVILPSVSLDSTTDQASITGGVVTTGLMVWNDGNGTLKEVGYYYWDGAKWVLTGNVDGGSSEPAKTIRKVPHITVSEWDNDQYALVQTTLADVNLPPANDENKNRIIAITNGANAPINYVSPAPVNNSRIAAGKGQLLMCDGQNWYVIGGL